MKYKAVGTMNTKDGIIKGTVSYNPSRPNKYQVNIDGELYGEHKTLEDAVDELKRSGFKNVTINENRFSTRQAKLIENYVRQKVKKMLKEATMRAVKVTYSDGNSISTNMNGAVTDAEIKNYYRIGSIATFERNGQEKKVKITNVEILPDETY